MPTVRSKRGHYSGYIGTNTLALNILRANGIGNVRQALYRNALSLDRLLAYAIA